MFLKKDNKEKTFDLWGVDMAESALVQMRQEVNSDAWKDHFEPWFNAQIAFLRAKNDTADGEELIHNQACIKWLKRLSNMRNDFNERKL